MNITITNDTLQHVLGVLLRAHGTLEGEMNGNARDTYEVWQMVGDTYDQLHALQPVITQPTPEQTAGPVGLTIKYPLGHSYAEQWRKADDVRCTKCASAEVWRDCDEPCNPEDSAPLHICVECGHAFEYETGNGYGDLNEQRLAQLRAVSTRVKGE